ncbi:UNVERIFIED_CONTAM: hypothetical protein Cloal_3845 [Acetivibrio alkalicellulosi]
MGVNEKIQNASVEEIKRGYVEKGDFYECMFCGYETEKGTVYKQDDCFYDAEKSIKLHIEKTHESVFEYLIELDKKVTGLSEHQNKLLRLFYQGKSDVDIQKEMDIGSSSTIRNHRFALKEKERQAKVFLVLMGLLKEKDKKFEGYIPPHKTIKMIDDRFNITIDESDKILKKYFKQGFDGPLETFNMKEKSKVVVLKHILKKFDSQRVYSEGEVNEILKKVYDDYVTIRRYLIEYGFLERKTDCSQYWVKENARKDKEAMDIKKELKQKYKEIKTEAGVYQIRNIRNSKIFIIATPNLKTINGRQFEMKIGSHKNQKLQEDLNKYGEDAFVFEVLEVLEEKEDTNFNKHDELKKLEEKWCNMLQPYGDRGYNK